MKMTRNDVLIVPFIGGKYVYTLWIFEMFSLFILSICVFFYMKILRRKEFCHQNLLVLLIAQPLTHLASVYTRPLRHFLFFFNLLNNTLLLWINAVMDTFVSTTFLVVLAYSVERLVAMAYVHEYDEMWTKRPTLGISLYLVALIYSAFLILVYNLGLNIYLAYGAQYVLFTFATFFFIYLRIASEKAYRRVASKKDSTVTERFDTARNLKASQLLLRVAPFKCLTNYLALGLYFWIWELHTPEYYPLYGVFYFYVSHLQLYLQMFLTILGHPVLKEEFSFLIGKKNRSRPEEVKDVLGKRMIFNDRETTQLYYDQIRTAWRLADSPNIGNLPSSTLNSLPSRPSRPPKHLEPLKYKAKY